ncbi:MAG: apolipoprotein N-acyltransferase [Treponemataceae bacterium]
MTKKLQVFYAFFSGIMISAGIANEILPLGSPFIGLFALVPLYYALRNARSFNESGIIVGVQAMIIHICSSFWLGYFRNFAIFTLWASAFAYGLWAYFIGQWLHLFFRNSCGLKITRMEEFAGVCGGGYVTKRIFAFCALWTIWEFSKSIGFLGYPWGTVLMTSYQWPLITQIVDITGTWGISFLFALFSAIVGEGLYLFAQQFLQNRNSLLTMYTRIATFCFLLFTVTILYGVFQYTKNRTPIDVMNTVIVQHNGDSWSSEGDTQSILVSQNLTQKALSQTTMQPDLVVWSETVLSAAFPYALESYDVLPLENPLFPFIKKINVPFIIGGPVVSNPEKRHIHNAANYFDKNGDWLDYYAKIQLVPFAEGIPFADNKIVQTLLKTLVGFSRGWTPGTEYKNFSVPLHSGKNVAISTPICFEDAFPETCKRLFAAGSQVFVNITNDSWSKTNSAEYQHFVIASFRSIELRKTMIRATNSGYSVVIDPVGKILADIPLFVQESIFVPVPIYERIYTFYYIFGDWVPFFSILLLSILAIFDHLKNCNCLRRKK